MSDIATIYERFLESTGVATDTRKIEKGTLFFALKGERFDGNQFALEALERGASCAVVDDNSLSDHPRLLKVEDVLSSLQALATYHRRMLDVPMIGITGSNGKTTTKELLAAMLSRHYKLHFTQGNFNNHIGVPLTLLSMPLNIDVAIIEMGANHVGEIAQLSRIAEPTHGVITNIGKAHLEGFGGIEGVKRGKSELYGFLAENNGVVFINLDEPFLSELARQKEAQTIVRYHQSKAPNPQDSILETILFALEPRVKIGFLSDDRKSIIEAQSNLVGYYNFQNIQTAISIARYFKVPHDKIKAAVEAYDPTNNRSQVIRTEQNTFLMDAYNANPTSMRNALDGFASMEGEYKIAILGDMLELGEYSAHEHQEVLEYAKTKGFAQIILVGEQFASLGKLHTKVKHFVDVHHLKSWFEEQDFKQATILLKASRGIGLERLLS